MAKILAVNPNTSREVTRAFVGAARGVAPQGVEIAGVTGRFGARIVTTEAQNIIAGHSALELVAEHTAGFDAVILAISFDTALNAIRSMLGVPVIGITEAALAAAENGGCRVGAVIFGAASQPLYQQVVERTAASSVDFEVVELTSAEDYFSPGSQDATVLNAAQRLADRGAERVMICGAALVGMAQRLSTRAPVPLVDGLAAVPACLNAIANVKHADRALPPLCDSVGLTPALAALLRGEGGP